MSRTEGPGIDVSGTKRLRSALAYERTPLILALLICGLLTLVSITVPPRLNFDPAMGMLEWRTRLAGGPAHSIIAPDPANIARDRTAFVAWWSPGQYLVPGWLTLTGLRLGAALSLTAGLSLLCCLLGWIRVFRYFAVSSGTTTLAVLFLSTFIYSTLPFRFFNGGEILLQAVLPWLVLAGSRVPTDRGIRAFVIAAAAILIAFFAEVTGIIVACAALAAGVITYILCWRRLSIGMFAGAAGALVAL